MNEPRPTEGLQIWDPEISFNEPYNIVQYQEMLRGLQLVDVKYKPGNDNLYCTGPGNLAYHIVTNAEVKAEREYILGTEGSRVTASVCKDFIVSGNTLDEEARVRNLHLGLGRTCLFLAANLHERQQHVRAIRDLTRVFSMLSKPIHNQESLLECDHERGLFYLLAHAGRKHKAMNVTEAEDAINALAGGMIDGAKWRKGAGKHLARSIMSKYANPLEHTPRPPRPSRPKPQPKRPTMGIVVITPRAPDRRYEKPPAPIISRQKRFLLDIDDNYRKNDDVERRTVRLYNQFCGEDPEQFTIFNKEVAKQVAYNGIVAYFDLHTDKPHDIPAQLADYLTTFGKKDMLRVVSAANLVNAKINTELQRDNKKLRKLAIETVPESFKTLRWVASRSNKAKRESEHIRKFGSLVQTYLEAVYPPKD